MTSIEFGKLEVNKVFVDECNHTWRKVNATTAVRVFIDQVPKDVQGIPGAFDKEERVHVLT